MDGAPFSSLLLMHRIQIIFNLGQYHHNNIFNNIHQCMQKHQTIEHRIIILILIHIICLIKIGFIHRSYFFSVSIHSSSFFVLNSNIFFSGFYDQKYKKKSIISMMCLLFRFIYLKNSMRD